MKEINKNDPENKCLYCLESVVNRRDGAKFCCDACKNKYHNREGALKLAEKDNQIVSLERENSVLKFQVTEHEKTVNVQAVEINELRKTNAELGTINQQLKQVINDLNAENQQLKLVIEPEPIKNPYFDFFKGNLKF